MFVLDPGTETELPHGSFRDLLLTSPTPNVRVGLQAIRFASESGKKLSELRLERVRMSWLGDTGIQLHGTNATGGAIVGVGLFDCEFSNCGQQGVSLSIAYAVQAIRCTFRNNQLQGLRIRGEELALYVWMPVRGQLPRRRRCPAFRLRRRSLPRSPRELLVESASVWQLRRRAILAGRR